MKAHVVAGPILLSYDCLLQSSGWHVFRAQMYLAIFMLPAALFCNMLFCLLRMLDTKGLSCSHGLWVVEPFDRFQLWSLPVF